MGLTYPMHGYVAAKGTPRVRTNKRSAHNLRAFAEIHAFEDMINPLAEELEREGCRLAYGAAETTVVSTTIHFETDLENRPKLLNLLESMNYQGTLVVPNRYHLSERGEA